MVSTRAKVCPHCGCPIEDILAVASPETESAVSDVVSDAVSEAPVLPPDLPAELSENVKSPDDLSILPEEEDAPEPEAPTQETHFIDTIPAYTCHGLKKTLSEEVFFRNTMLRLAMNEDTPPDLFDTEFLPIEQDRRHFATVTGYVVGSYTATVGYEKERKWTDYDEYGHPSEKREKYIEWAPFAGTYNGKQKHDFLLDQYGPFDDGIIGAYSCVINATDGASYPMETPSDPKVPSEAEIAEVLDLCKISAQEECRAKLPGKEHKDFTFSGTVTLDRWVAYEMPTYTQPFFYRERLYKRSAIAVESRLEGDFGTMPDIGEEIYAQVEKKIRPLGIVALVMFALSLIAPILFLVLHEHFYRGLMLAVSGALVGVAVILAVAYWVAFTLYRKSIIRANLRAKIRAVDKVLTARGIEPLSEEEKSAIMENKK